MITNHALLFFRLPKEEERTNEPKKRVGSYCLSFPFALSPIRRRDVAHPSASKDATGRTFEIYKKKTNTWKQSHLKNRGDVRGN